MSTVVLWLRRLLAIVPFFWWWRYGCERCHLIVAQMHSTEYDSVHGSGCLPLCEWCWQDLGTPEARIPYYRALYNHWQRDAESHGWELPFKDWKMIEAAVHNEVAP